MSSSLYLLVTLDTKGEEARFIAARLESLGVATTIVDTGCLGAAPWQPHVTRERIFEAAGESLEEIRQRQDRGAAVTAAAKGAAAVVSQAWLDGKLCAVMALGGSAGTTIGTAAMRALPIGVPKLMVSTMASGQVAHYVGEKDVMLLHSVVDIAGINRVSRQILGNAAHAAAGMVLHAEQGEEPGPSSDKPIVAATMFGVTTPCVQSARKTLEEAGYEVLVFHATGNGGRAMEALVRDGLIAGVLDITTTELADELVGGVLTAGPERLTAATQCGVPQVVSVGATDMVNFGPRDTVPTQFQARLLYEHNPTVTLMRTTEEECAAIGSDLATKVAAAGARATILLPLRGVSAIDAKDQPFEDVPAREALFGAIRQHHGPAKLTELDQHINDQQFAQAAAEELLALMTNNQAER